MNIDLALNSVLHEQSGSTQPQIVSPKLLLESLKESQFSFPRDTILLFPWSKNTSSIILKGYVVSVPLANKEEYKEYHLVPVPIPVNDDKLIYIRTEKSILRVDKTRQCYYFN